MSHIIGKFRVHYKFKLQCILFTINCCILIRQELGKIINNANLFVCLERLGGLFMGVLRNISVKKTRYAKSVVETLEWVG